MQQDRKPRAHVGLRAAPRQRIDEQRVLCNRENIRAKGLPIPAGDAGKPVCDVLDLDVEGGRVEQVEPAAGQHALPGAG